jgi:hypothetical protein
MVLSVHVIGSLKLGCALKSCIIRVLVGNDWFNRLEDSEAITSWQLGVSSLLEIAEKLILL